MVYQYTDVFSRLTYETAAIIFVKKNGEFRTMLGTRNLRTAEIQCGYIGGSLAGHDKRCSIKNNNIAVVDMYLGEVRSFNVNRLVAIEYYGEIRTKEELEIASRKFNEFEKLYEEEFAKSDMERLQ